MGQRGRGPGQRLGDAWRVIRGGATDAVRDLGRRESRARVRTLQIAKATLAAVLAWYVASEVVGSEAAWLAPMTAVLMVHSTVYRSISEGVKRVVAVALGVVLAAAAGNTIGLNALGLLVVVPLSLLAARLPWIRAQGEYIAITAVLLLTFGASTDEGFLLSYVSDTAVGVVGGALVNALLFPPVYQRSTRAAVSDLATDIAELLRDVATGARDRVDYPLAEHWRRRADGFDDEARAAQSTLAWHQESQRLNPWPRRESRDQARRYQPAITVLWHVAVELQSLARSLRDGVRDRDRRDRGPGDDASGGDARSAAGQGDEGELDDLFAAAPPLRDDLAPLLESVAEVVETFGDDPQLRAGRLSPPVRESLERAESLASDMSARLPQVSLGDPGRFAATGAVLQTVHRMLGYLRDLHQQPEEHSDHQEGERR